MTSRWTQRALTALTKIHDYIATDNPVAADLLRDRAIVYVETTLISHPQIGRPGRVEGTREGVIHPSYILVYRVRGEAVEVVTVRHTGRLWPKGF